MSAPTASAAVELRQAADKLTVVPHCGGKHSDCACDSAAQFAGLLRAIAKINDEDPTWSDRHPAALDIARRINAVELAPAREPVPFVDYLPDMTTVLDEPAVAIDPEDPNRLFTCACGRPFETKEALDWHINSHPIGGV